MNQSRASIILRDVLAVLVVGAFMFPLFWWALTSIKPISAIFDKDRVVFFDFVPTWINYGVTMLGMSRSQLAIDQGIGMGVGGAEAYDSRRSIIDSMVVSVGSTAVTTVIAVLAAYALSRMAFRGRATFLNWVLGQRFMPPIAILIPLVTIYKTAGLRDTDNLYMGYLGLMLIYALVNLPIAVLLMKSFFDDVPRELDEAAIVDGSSNWGAFFKVVLPLVKGGLASTALFVFILNWSDFLIALLLTNRKWVTIPVFLNTLVTADSGAQHGPKAALGLVAAVPVIIFGIAIQKYLVRGLTFGAIKK